MPVINVVFVDSIAFRDSPFLDYSNMNHLKSGPRIVGWSKLPKELVDVAHAQLEPFCEYVGYEPGVRDIDKVSLIVQFEL